LSQKRDAGPFSVSRYPLPDELKPAATGDEPLVEILLVEDSPADVRMMREALQLAGIPHRLSTAADGDEALLFLRRQGRYADAPIPAVILLDLKLPRISGHAVLGALKLDPALSAIPVIVLTSSHAQRDLVKSYDLKADFFITKPVGLNLLAAEMKIIASLVKRTSR
jgi:chemotaxis family two-component system response regulator Rcp1